MGHRNTRRENFMFGSGMFLILIGVPAFLFTLGSVLALLRGEDGWWFFLLFAAPMWWCVSVLLKWRKTSYPENHRYFTIKVSGRHRFDYDDIPDGPYTLAQLETNVGMVNFIESIMMNQSVVLGDTPENMKVIKDRFAKDYPSNRIRSKISGMTAIDQVTVPVEAWKLMTKPQREAILKIAAYINLRRETRTEQYMPPIYRALGV